MDMGENGTGVDHLVVSRAGHLALRWNPQDWHRETILIEDILVRLRARRKRQDPRTERLLQSSATVLINSRCLSAASVQKASGSCLKNVAQSPRHDEHPRHCWVCSVPSDRCCFACSHPLHFATVAPTRPFARGVFSTLTIRAVVSMFLPLPLNQIVSAEVNIVEEEQNMWRRIQKGTKFQLDAGTQECLVVVVAASETPLCC